MFFRSSAPSRPRRGAAATNSSFSLLGKDLRITGDVACDGEIQIDGQVAGDVITDRLIVSESGVVDGAIAANSVRVLGTVNGPITAGAVKLGRSARVTGDIVHQTLSVEEGAFVTGHCRRSDGPEGEAGGGGEVGAAALGEAPHRDA